MQELKKLIKKINGKYYHINEVWQLEGPFKDESEAIEELKKYLKFLNEKPSK